MLFQLEKQCETEVASLIQTRLHLVHWYNWICFSYCCSIIYTSVATLTKWDPHLWGQFESVSLPYLFGRITFPACYLLPVTYRKSYARSIHVNSGPSSSRAHICNFTHIVFILTDRVWFRLVQKKFWWWLRMLVNSKKNVWPNFIPISQLQSDGVGPWNSRPECWPLASTTMWLTAYWVLYL